jgi:hypothetical protein
MKLINLTAHTINVQGLEPIETSGYVARVHTHMHQDGSIRGVPIFVRSGETVVNLPEEEPDVMFIVTSYVREALPKRKDLLSPTKLVRDRNGMVVGCGAFEMNP